MNIRNLEGNAQKYFSIEAAYRTLLWDRPRDYVKEVVWSCGVDFRCYTAWTENNEKVQQMEIYNPDYIVLLSFGTDDRCNGVSVYPEAQL